MRGQAWLGRASNFYREFQRLKATIAEGRLDEAFRDGWYAKSHALRGTGVVDINEALRQWRLRKEQDDVPVASVGRVGGGAPGR